MSGRRLEGNQNGHAPAGPTAAQKMDDRVAQLRRQWATDPRWSGIERTYGAAEVVALRGSVQEEHTLARLGSVT